MNSEWLQKNWIALAGVIVTIVSTWALYGYRLDSAEKEISQLRSDVNAINTTTVQIQISLAKISTDIEYLKYKVDRLQ